MHVHFVQPVSCVCHLDRKTIYQSIAFCQTILSSWNIEYDHAIPQINLFRRANLISISKELREKTREVNACTATNGGAKTIYDFEFSQ